MRTCPHCKIEVGGETKKCPFCQNALIGEPTPNNWPSENILQKQSTLYKVQLFIALSAAFLCFGLDFAMRLNHGIHWSIIVDMWLIVFEFGIIRLFQREYSASRILTLFVLIICALISVTTFYLDHLFFYDFAMFIVPYIFIGTLIANFVLALMDSQISNAMIYLLSNILLGVLPYLVLLVLGRDISVAWVLCMFVSAITFIGACVFRGRAVVSELQKRFNM